MGYLLAAYRDPAEPTIMDMASFRRQYETRWAYEYRPDDRRYRDLAMQPNRIDHYRTQPNFVEALFEALSCDDDFDFGMVIHRPEQHDPRQLNRWIWGPHGEFTGFARINLFEDLDRQLYHSRAVKALQPVQYSLSDIPEVSFDVMPLWTLSTWDSSNSRFLVDPGYSSHLYSRDLDGSGLSFVRFSTYADYVRWDHRASRDEYRAPRTVSYELESIR